MPYRASLLQVVTFAANPLHGNPAFVLGAVADTPDRVLATACVMLRADVVAVLGAARDGATPLRFYTEAGPHGGAGHATMAAAHAALDGNFGHAAAAGAITFSLAGGRSQRAYRDGRLIAVEFPAMPGTPTDRIAELAAALGTAPVETWVAPFGHVAVYDDPATVAGLRPDLARLCALDRSAVIATARGDTRSDIVIRVFAPKIGLPEDPVCGTAHRIIVPYWAARLGQRDIHSRQLSSRGGDLWCRDQGETVVIAGETSLVMDGTIRLPGA